MITYPYLKKDATIGVTAPSSGIPTELHEILKLACTRLEEKGFQVIYRRNSMDTRESKISSCHQTCS